MATKESFTKDKNKILQSSNPSSNLEYKNLNLNQNNGCQNNVVQSKSSLIDSRKISDRNNCNESLIPSKPNFSLLNKNDKNYEYLDLHKNSQENSLKPWNKKNFKNSSTLSLHISAYENSVIEAINSTAATSSGQKSDRKKWKNAAFGGAAVQSLHSFFEFPRQQQDEEMPMQRLPEVMQFKASQKLLSPNSTQSSEITMTTQSSSVEPPAAAIIISDDDDEENNIRLPKKVRKKLLINSDDDDEVISSAGKDIEEDIEGDSEDNDDDTLSGEDDEDESLEDDSEGAEDDDGEDDDENDDDESLESGSSNASQSSLLSFDSEFSWDEFQYIDDNAENSFIQDEEESLRERYNTVMKLLLSEQAEEGFDSLSILYEEPLIQKQLTSDFSSFDWEKAKTQFVKNCEPKMRMLTFGVCRALARFATDPTLFYLQALSLRPADKALWYEFGCAAAKIHNFKTSELAFKQCLSPHSDAGIKLAIVYFYSKDYHKCLPLLREMLTSRPNNLALWVLKSEISKINTFWKYFVDLYFPTNSLFFQEPTVPSDIYEKVLQEIRNFSTTEPPPEKFRSDYSIEPLHSDTIRLNIEQTMENFAEFLCKYFDQSSKQQLPYNQTVHFAKEKRHHSNRRNISSLSGSIKEPTTPLPDSDSLLSISMNDEIDAMCSSMVEDMVTITEDVEAVVKKLVDDVVKGKIPKPVKAKRRPPRKNPNLSLDVRRSGRTSKEIPFEAMDSPVIGTFQQPTNTEPVTIRTLLDLPSGDSTFPPLEFPGAKGFPFDELKYDIIPPFMLETFNVYLTTLLNKAHISMEELLQTFLYFFSWNLPAGCNLTAEQRKLFLEVYIRWTETFCQPLPQHCLNASIKDISIHLLAAELDIEDKLKAGEACEMIFNRFSGIQQQSQPENTVKLMVVNENQEEEEEQKMSEKEMRNKAIELLAEVDPAMAAKIKSCMEESRISTKTISKESNIEDAIGALTFSRDDYYSSGFKVIRSKTKKQNAVNVEPQEMPSIELLDKEEKDETTLSSFNLFEPSISEPPTSTKLSEFNIKFIQLWADLSKIMQRVAKSAPKESDENSPAAEREMSPMDETDMISLLTNCPGFSDEEENIFSSLKDIQESAPNYSKIEKLLKEYLNLLETFIHENKYKKEIESDAIKTFMDETKNAIEAMKSVAMAQNAIDYNDDIEMDDAENERLKEMAIRFYWFKFSKLEENVELKKAYLSTILHLIDLDTPIYTQLLDENEKCTVITARNIVKILMHEFRHEKVVTISKLIAAEKHQEVIEQFTTDFNWYSCDEKEVITNIQILLSSFEAIKDRKGPIEWICRLLDCVISGKFETRRDDIYQNCLKQLSLLNLEEIEHDILKLLAKRLVVCSEYDRFKKNVELWKILYRVASILEGSYNESSRIEMYQTIEAIKILMPTKALCLLAEGHRILGEEHHCCTINNGELLYFFIDELYKNFYEHRFEDHYYSKLVQRNIELQLIQCFRCLFDSSVGKSVVYDHECSKSLIPNITIAKKVQPFLIPTLPMFDDEKFTTNDVIEALTRVFPWIENEKMVGFDQAWADFEAFIKEPPFFKFQINKSYELKPIGDFENANLWPCIEITDENREKLELFVYLRYVLLVIKYKKQAYSWEENEKLAQLAKECLVLSGPLQRGLLPVKVIHSLWAICAYTHTMYFCYLEDDELAKEANSYFYMFKMAFLQYPEAFQLHIDVAIAYYQINSRIQRHKRSLPQKCLTEEIEAKIAKEDLIKQCQLHFNQFRYRISQTNEYPKDISWIEAYFSGKIAEHEEKPAAEIFEHYYRCAMLMRAEAYTYPLRVNKTSQENVEPLELHYRVHVYAMKQIFALQKMKPFENRVAHLKIIRYYLRLFLGHFIFAKKNPPPLPTIDTALPFIDSTPTWDFEDQPEMADEGEEYFDDEIQDTLELMVSYTDLNIECIEYCRRAFETIVKRFPHYKSYYQIALLHLINKEFQKGLDVIFIKLFKGKFVSFEKVTDIERTDIERSDTLAYHLKKLIRLTIALLKKCRDIPKTNLILEDLVKESSTGRLKLKPAERESFINNCIEIYQDAVIKVTRKKNNDQINSLTKLLEKASSILRINKKPEADEKVKLLIARCRNSARSIVEAREKQRNNELAAARNNELAAAQIQAILEMQKVIAAKQKQDFVDKIQKATEEEAKKLREEEEKKKRAAEAAAEKQKKDMTEKQKHQLAYSIMMEAKRAEEAKKSSTSLKVQSPATSLSTDEAKKVEILKLAIEKLNRICNNPLLLPHVKQHVDERKPALIDALKVNVSKGESLATIVSQLDKFDNNLQKHPAAPPPSSTISNKLSSSIFSQASVPLRTTNMSSTSSLQVQPPSTSANTLLPSAQKLQKSNQNASNSTPNKHQTEPLNLSTNLSLSSAVSKPQTLTSSAISTPNKLSSSTSSKTSSSAPRREQPPLTSSRSVLSPSVQKVQNASNSPTNKQQQTDPQTLSISTILSNYSTALSNAVSKSQNSVPPSITITKNVQTQQKTPPKPATSQSRNNATLQTPSPRTTPQKSPQPSTSKASTPSKATPVDNSTSREQVILEIGKLLQQYAPGDLITFEQLKNSMLQKTTLELQQIYSTMFVKYICGKTSNVPSTTSSGGGGGSGGNISGKRTAAAALSPSTTASKIRRTDTSGGTSTRPPQLIPQQKSTTLQAPATTVSQKSPQRSSTTASASKPSQSRVPQQQQQQQYRFDHLTEQVKKVLPTSIAANKSASDDDIMIIGESKGPSLSAKSSATKNVTSATPPSSTATPSSLTPTSLTMLRRFINSSNRESSSRQTPPPTTSKESNNRQGSAAKPPPQTSTPQPPRLLPQSAAFSSPSKQPQQTNSSASKSKTQHQQQHRPSSSQQQQQRTRSVAPSSTSSTTSTSSSNNITPASIAQLQSFNVLAQQQMRHLLQNATPQQQQQILQAFLSNYNQASSSSTNQKR